MTLEQILLVVGIGVGVLALAGVGGFLFYKFYYKRHHRETLIQGLEREYNYYHGLLTANCQNIISRIEVISHSNLVYAEYHNKFLKRYRDLLEKNDKFVEEDIYELNNYLTDEKKKDFKECYERALSQLDKFKRLVLKFNDELIDLIKPEEVIREKALRVKERNNLNYKKYLSVSTTISIAAPSFEKIFKKIDSKFRTFETLIDGAEYAEAEEVLKPIIEVNEKLADILNKLPRICGLFEYELANNVTNLRKKFDETIAKDIPIYNIITESTFTFIDGEISQIRKLIIGLKADEADERVQKAIKFVNDLDKKIDFEIECREKYKQDYKEIYKYSSEVSNRALKIHNEIDKYREYYVLNSKFAKTDEIILDLNNLVTDSKRKVDSHVNSGLKQPYSIIVNELTELKETTEKIDMFIQDFDSYIISLKETSEKAYSIVLESTIPLKICENNIKRIDLDAGEMNKLQFKFDRCFTLLNEIYRCLTNKPIDIDKINNYVNEFKLVYDDTTTTVKNFIKAKDECVMYLKKLNESRLGFQNVNEDLKRAEELFRQGNFVAALNILKTSSSRRIGLETSI